MNRAEFLEFMDAINGILPFEASNSLAHVVLEDDNYDDEFITQAIKDIENKTYLDSTGATFLIQNPVYIAFVSGLLKLMLLIPEDVRLEDEHDYD